MQLILREEVDHLGRRGDIVNVARGYARNFLLPKRLAMEVTDDNLRVVEKEKKIYEKKLAEEKIVAEEVAATMERVKLTFARKVHGDADELYGSVSPTDVAEALEKDGHVVERRRIALSEPIKSLGDFTFSIKLHPEVTVTLPITVIRDASAAPEETGSDEGAALPTDDKEETEPEH